MPLNLLGAVFVFGLIHGFGLSTRLQQLPLGNDSLSMLGRILSFNVGVEFGQMVALLVMVGLLSARRKRPTFEVFSRVSNYALVLTGLVLLIMQLHGYWHESHPNDFRFPVEEHLHIHEDMTIENLQEDSGRDNL